MFHALFQARTEPRPPDISSMGLSVFEKLQADYQRFLEIERACSIPRSRPTPTGSSALAKERGTLAKVAIPYGRYLELGRQIAEAEALCAGETDAEMRSYAEAELDEPAAPAAAGGRGAPRPALRPAGRRRPCGADRRDPGRDRRRRGRPVRPRPLRDVPAVRRADGLEVRDARHRADRAGRLPRGLVQRPGEGAFRHLQFEGGGHRVQRVPETEAQGRIHTSTATVAVLPEPEEVDIVIRPEDLSIDVMRSGGPGGQHQNKTESGVRITHLPTGVVVNCRDERSQHKNKAKAMRILRSRLFEQMRESARSERDQTRREP